MREQVAQERKLSEIFTFMSILILILLSDTKQNILQQVVYDILYISSFLNFFMHAVETVSANPKCLLPITFSNYLLHILCCEMVLHSVRRTCTHSYFVSIYFIPAFLL